MKKKNQCGFYVKYGTYCTIGIFSQKLENEIYLWVVNKYAALYSYQNIHV